MADPIREYMAQEFRKLMRDYLRQQKSAIEAMMQALDGAEAGEPAPAPKRRQQHPAKAGETRPARLVHAKRVDMSDFKLGQIVMYRQGMGHFDAEIVELDAGKNLVKVRRIPDGKEVWRPAAKVEIKSASPKPAPKPEPEPDSDE